MPQSRIHDKCHGIILIVLEESVIFPMAERLQKDFLNAVCNSCYRNILMVWKELAGLLKGQGHEIMTGLKWYGAKGLG